MNKRQDSPPTLQREVKNVPYMTGFCHSGGHEGTRILSAGGTLLRSCSGVFVILGKTYTCRCDCHDAFRQIAELTGLTTATIPVTMIVPPVDLIGSLYGPSSIRPEPTPTDAHDDRGEPPTTVTAGAMPTPPVAPTTPAPIRIFSPLPTPDQFKPTPSGQRARGQLEAQVGKVIFKLFAHSGTPAPITPVDCAMLVNPASPPSQGAVYSIFQRWQRQGLCELGAKPFRFLKLTDQGRRTLERWA